MGWRHSGPGLALGDAGDTAMTDNVPGSVQWSPHSTGVDSCAQTATTQGGRGCDGGSAGRVTGAQ